MTTTTAKKPRSPEHAAAFAAYCAANQTLSLAELDRQAAEFAHLNAARHYSHGLRKSRALRRELEEAAAKVEAASVAVESTLAALRAVRAAEAQATV